MRLNRKQFLAMFEMLAALSARLLAFASKTSAGEALHPRRDGPWLADWRQARWVRVAESVHPTAQRLILAARRQEMLALRYWGGSAPGRKRYVSPRSVFQLDGSGPLYLSAYCHLRRAERVFNVGRVELLAANDSPLCITE